MTERNATAIGFTAVLMWALLALFTIGSAPKSLARREIIANASAWLCVNDKVVLATADKFRRVSFCRSLAGKTRTNAQRGSRRALATGRAHAVAVAAQAVMPDLRQDLAAIGGIGRACTPARGIRDAAACAGIGRIPGAR